MQQSALRLEQYNLLKISIEPVEGVEPLPVGQYADFSNAVLTSGVTLNGFEVAGQPRFTVELTVEGSPAEGKSFPYRFSVGIVGAFDGQALPQDRVDELVAANGASLLYGALREQLLSITMRCVLGPLLLPSVNFADVGAQIEAQKLAMTASVEDAKPPAIAP